VPLALTGWEWGLLSTAVVFIVFALVVALVVPRSRPTFPAVHLGWFIAACIVLFAAQMTSVVLLAEVGETHEAAPHEPEPGETETTPTETEPTETTLTETTETETTETTEPTETGPTETETTETTGTETTPPPQAGGDPAAGNQVFQEAACGGCHTLADAGATGTIGPNLDTSMPPAELVVERVTNGSGVMPSFRDELTPQQIQDVAAYVSSVAGR
jgi:cytochrome c6